MTSDLRNSLQKNLRLSLKKRSELILQELKCLYPDAECALNYRNAFELLIATILSAQCTDVRVNQVTASLFQKYSTPEDFAGLELSELEDLIKPTGFFRNKALAIQSSSRQILREFNGQVPKSLAELIRLKGVGRKTASVVMGNAYGVVEGIVVDTHIARLSQRLGFTSHQDPEKIEQDLMKLIPFADWIEFPHLMISHGRTVCKARKPACQQCSLNTLCPAAK